MTFPASPHPHAAATPPAPAMPDGLPEKFWDAEAAAVRLDALVKSYLELERKLGGLGGRGVPEAADGYRIAEPHALVTSDPDVNRRLHAAGFSQEQAQLVYELAAERLLPMIGDVAAEFVAQSQLERLAEHFGGEDRWRSARGEIAAWGKARLAPEVFEALCCSADGVLAMQRMMASGEPGLVRGAEPASGAPGEAELRRMMRDRRYWRDKDPEYVARVREGFKRLYPG